jgi:ketosteroid isomerase-like protein
MSNVDTVKAAYEAFKSGDLATLKETWADNISWWSSSETKPGGQRDGVDAVMQMMAEVPEQWSTFTVEPALFIDAGKYVVVSGNSTVANSRGSDTSRFAHILEFNDDGKVVRAEMHADSAKGYKLQN